MKQIFEKRRIIVGHHILDVRSGGVTKAQPVILIHGIGVSGRYFAPFATVMAEKYRVFVINLPGYGKTPKPTHPLSVAQLAGVVADFIKQEHIEGAVIIGHSMGCQTAAHVAKNNPGLLKKMILLGPTVNPKERRVWMQAVRLFQDTFRESLKVNRILSSDYARMGIVRYLKTCRYMLNDHIEDTIRNCNVPVCIIRGQKDAIVPLDWARSLADVANGEFAEVPHSPHVVQFKTANETAKLCTAFIER